MNSKGIDISHWQKDLVDFAGAKADGYDWVICRASHGNNKDATFLPNVQKARAEGFVIGAYHYIYVSHGLVQVEKMIEQVNAAGGVHFPLFIDVERYDNDSATVAEWHDVIDSCAILIRDAGFEMGIYTSYWMWNLTNNMSMINGIPAEDYMMWVAHWSEVSNPSLPIPWNKNPNNWELWQQGSSLRPTWYPGRLDYGVYNGTTQELRAKYLDEEHPPDTHEEIWAAIWDINNRLAGAKKAL